MIKTELFSLFKYVLLYESYRYLRNCNKNALAPSGVKIVNYRIIVHFIQLSYDFFRVPVTANQRSYNLK